MPPKATPILVTDQAIAFAPAIPREVQSALAKIHTRRALLAAPLYQQWQPAIDAVTDGLCYDGPATAPLPTPQGFIRVVTWNIQRGIHADGQIQLLRSHPVLADADVILLNEVDLGMARSGNRDVAKEMAQALGFAYVFGNSYLCLDHGDVRDVRDGHSGEANQQGLHGNAILSRLPIRRAQNISIAITKDKFQSRNEKRLGHKKALLAELDTPWGPLCCVAAHLDPIGSPLQRAHQLRDIIAAIDAQGCQQVLIGGDFNTTTYDLASMPRLLGNLARKFLRGGIPHAVAHYMQPWTLYERPVFDVLREHAFETGPFNDLTTGTMRYEVGDFDSESKVRDFLPGFAVSFLRWRLKPWNGVAPLKIDWFAARGLQVAPVTPADDATQRASVAPMVVERATWQGQRLADHDPVVVDVVGSTLAKTFP